MSSKYSQADDSAKEFYYYLGLLSTNFAVLEYNVLALLSQLIVDDFVLTNTILENNSLSQNIELLKKINRYRKFEEKSIAELIEQMSGIRAKRNLFIHGIWSKPEISENDLVIICSEPKLLYEENKHGRSWASNKNHKLRLSDLKKLADNIDNIILCQKYLINKLKNEE